jgi:hypothetical protein
LYGCNSPYFIPPTFLFKLNQRISPHVCQLVALSAITGHSFADCMSICGFDLRSIFIAQLQFHVERTVLVTPQVAESGRGPALPASGISAPTSRYLFARIGRNDAGVSPGLIPGSVVRVDRYSAHLFHRNAVDSAKGPFWLIEHASGLTCCRVQHVGDEHVVLLPHRHPFFAWPLQLHTEARILGMIDVRPHAPNQVNRLSSAPSERFPAFPSLANTPAATSLSKLLRLSRSRVGLTLRASHAMTIAAAELLGNPEHRIALGLLSDYEASEKLPRHIAKIMSLCMVYCIDFWELLRTNRMSENLPEGPMLDAVAACRSSEAPNSHTV